jgi:hypothetical protein
MSNSQVNRQWCVARPHAGSGLAGMSLSRDHFHAADAPIPETRDGEVLIKSVYFSPDPMNHAWVRGVPGRLEPIPVGQAMRGGVAGRVGASCSTSPKASTPSPTRRSRNSRVAIPAASSCASPTTRLRNARIHWRRRSLATMTRYPLFQQAYFVNSIDDAAQKWAKLLGAGPFFAVRHHKTEEFSYRGTEIESDVSYAFGYLGDTMIQFIEQHDEQPSIYRDMYARGQEGFHHVAYLVHDFDAERQRILDSGFELACELYADGVNAAYFDTRSVTGGFTEIHGDPSHILGVFAIWRRTHERWDGRGSAMLEFDKMPEYRRAQLKPLND